MQLMDELELQLPDRAIATASEGESATTVERLAVALLHAVPHLAARVEA
jgi:hypothetical protein